MSNVSAKMEEESNLKDGSSSGPPLLFRHPSMQKIRHCCQNLNLFPYLLYSFDNSKSHPIARKVHLCFDQLVHAVNATVYAFQLYQRFRQTLLRGVRPEEHQETKKNDKLVSRFPELPRKRKQTPLYLTLAVYFAPLLILFQLAGLLGLMVSGKYTPGFIFLISALLFLGCISLKIMFYESLQIVKLEKKKAL